jgi:hypothetical protein
MSSGRARRLPVSCEPCRLRKIRCPRDATPCGTCRRRGVSAQACQYAKRTPTHSALSPYARSSSQPAYADSAHNTDLAARVRKLEQLLQTAVAPETRGGAPSTSTPPSHQSYDYLSPASEALPSLETLGGTLHTTEAGHQRFVPQSMFWSPDQAQRIETASASSCSFGLARCVDANQLLAVLPPRRACQELVNVYFASFASLFHILHDPTFHRQFACFLEDPQSMPLAWLALLYSLLATAVLALPPDSELLGDLSRQSTPLKRCTELSHRYRDMVMRCLEADNYLWNHNVTILQSLIIFIHGLSHSNGQTWTLLGLAHHLALNIGCHVDPESLGLGILESEERRRSWAGLMMLYTNQNTALGHIGLPHTALSANSRPPADIDDEDIRQDNRTPSNPPGRATQMTYLLLKFRLYDLCAEICANVLCKQTPDLNLVQRIDETLRQERSSWESRLTEAIEIEPLPVHHLAHLNIIYSYSNHITLLLHQRQALDSRFPLHIRQWASHRCIETAKHLLGVHATLNEASELTPFRWYGRGLGSFHAFHAAALLAQLDMAGVKGGGPRSDHIGLLQRCLSRFKSLTEYSSVCERAAPVLQLMVNNLLNHSSDSQRPLGLGATVQQVTPDHSGESHSSGLEGGDMSENWDALLWDVPLQNWLSPASLPWSDWSGMLDHEPTPLTT